jgi:hypothetical protein
MRSLLGPSRHVAAPDDGGRKRGEADLEVISRFERAARMTRGHKSASHGATLRLSV